MAFDSSVLLFIQENIRCLVLDKVFSAITALGEYGIIWIIFGAVLFISKKTRKTGLLVFAALILSLIINNGIVKNLVQRARPFDVIEGLATVIPHPTDYSFPSGHTGSSFAASLVIYKNVPKKYGVPAVILACLIAVSRLYLGVHYPTDVIMGAISGSMIAYGLMYVTRQTV